MFSLVLPAFSLLLWTLSGKFLMSVSLGFFPGFFSFYFTWNIFLCLPILFNSLCLYEIRWNCYLSQLQVCPCVGVLLCSLCVPSGLSRKARSEVSAAASSPRLCWQLLPWWEVGLELEGLQPEPVATKASSLLIGITTCRGGVIPKLPEQEPWGSVASLQCDGSWEVAGACVLGPALLCWLSFFPQSLALVRGWVRSRGAGATPLNWPCLLPSVHSEGSSGSGSHHSRSWLHPSGGCRN